MYERILAPEHAWTTISVHELARIYRDTGRYAESEELFAPVQAIYEKTLGKSIQISGSTVNRHGVEIPPRPWG